MSNWLEDTRLTDREALAISKAMMEQQKISPKSRITADQMVELTRLCIDAQFRKLAWAYQQQLTNYMVLEGVALSDRDLNTIKVIAIELEYELKKAGIQPWEPKP